MTCRLFFAVLMLLPVRGLFCQQMEALSFDDKLFDFGEIEESAGPVIHEFRFTNQGEDSVRIDHVQASCGCTTPSWSEEAVAPGQTGFVQARYDPHNRPGVFNKFLTVQFADRNEPVKLYIRGTVRPATGSPAEELTNKLGAIRTRYRTLNMGKVYTLDTPTVKSFDVYNDSDSAITFQPDVQKPPHVAVQFVPVTLQPGQLGKIRVIYDAKKKGSLGFSSDNITFFTDEPEGRQRKELNLYATIEEYFAPMTEKEIKLAPHLTINEPVYDFDRMKPDKRITTKFKIINSGQSPLGIRQVSGNCACIHGTVKKDKLKPGEETEVEVTFDSTGRVGNQQKSVTIYSNDPLAPAQRLTVRGYVESD